MSLLNTIRNDLKAAMKAGDTIKKDTLRMVVGEVPRLNKKAGEEVTDKEIQLIIEKLVKAELVVLEINGTDAKDSDYVNILKAYLPSKMTSGEITSWIDANIDLSKFEPKIKAMGFIMKSLNGKVEGSVVKDILMKL